MNDALNREAAAWYLDTLLYDWKPADPFERKELIPFPPTRWEKLKAVPVSKIIEIGETYHIKMNGAGPQSWRFDVVPDRPPWLFGVDFAPPANCHDVLFALGGSRIEFIMANLYFHYNMRNACRAHFPKSWACGIRYGAVTSRLYYEAVDEFGWKHFVKKMEIL